MDLRSLMNNESSEAAAAAAVASASATAAAATAARQGQTQGQGQGQTRESSQQRSIGNIHPPASLPRTASGSYASPVMQQNHYAPKPAPPLYQHSPPVDARASNGTVVAQRLTPLHTPTQTPGVGPGGSAGYPFPAAPFQSPSQQREMQQAQLRQQQQQAQQQHYQQLQQHQQLQQQQQQQQHAQYRVQEGHQVTTPGASSRPPAPLYQYSPQTASSPYGAPPPPPPLQAAHSQHSAHHSVSSTPPTMQQHSQTPVETSAAIAAAQQYNSHHHQYSISSQHPSQPSTPLGPPSSAHYSRPYMQTQSPYTANPNLASANLIHHRTSSGASHGPGQSMASNSPAQPKPMSISMGQASESPSVYGPPLRQPSRALSGSYMSESERERSVSVSPKTRVVPRQGSQGSYYSSQDPMSARNSISMPSHQQQQQQQQQPLRQPQQQIDNERLSHQLQAQHEPQNLRSSGDMSHGISPLTTTRLPPSFSSHAAPPAPSPSSRSSQTPQLKNLLNGNDTNSSPVRPSPAASHSQDFSPHSRPPSAVNPKLSASPSDTRMKIEQVPIKAEPQTDFPRQEALLQQPVTATPPAFTPAPEPAANYGQQQQQQQQQQPVPLKRAAESEPDDAQLVKRAKKRYAEPPVWARYSKRNPRYGDNLQSLTPPPQQLPRRPSPFQSARASLPTTNGHAPPVQAAGTPSSVSANGLQPQANQRLGPWEYNIRNVQPMNDFLKEVGDFLIVHATRNDIGAGDARSGTLEIEAKLGTLIDRRTGVRVSTLGTTNMVLDHALTSNGSIRFESFMTELQHKQMNDFLNNAAQKSMEPHRVKMGYKHRYERDSFAPLNQAGYEALPPSAKAQLRPNHSLKLRTTVDTKVPKGTPEPVLGRIVKIRLDDLDIHCPRMDFDCRISVNVEVDLNNRPNVDPSLIVDALAADDPERAPDRFKDRLSYKHLAYSVDLTQVRGAGGKKTHELEIEVDTTKLREEALRCVQGQDNAYETLVDGLLSNVLTLMKAQKEGAAMMTNSM
ncbi:hypothetical protein AAFC00_006418 [Neodothiora populina]|uniref:mRNA-capping enzyme subunit beta n=1 Tax=Neodothiora populina TaxID=2781224 RepID=A0ABR3P5G4_9PEZI